MTSWVLSVDFEAIDGYGTWLAYAAGIFAYPSGEIVDHVEASIERPLENYDYLRKAFWLRRSNHVAHQQLVQRAWPLSRLAEAELQLVRFVRDAHRRFPSLEVVSDHPGFDLKILDEMNQRYQQPTCSERANGTFQHPVCLFSLEWMLNQVGANLSVASMREVEQVVGPLHTPWYDVCHSVARYFRCKDWLAQMRPAVTKRNHVHPQYATTPFARRRPLAGSPLAAAGRAGGVGVRNHGQVHPPQEGPGATGDEAEDGGIAGALHGSQQPHVPAAPG